MGCAFLLCEMIVVIGSPLLDRHVQKVGRAASSWALHIFVIITLMFLSPCRGVPSPWGTLSSWGGSSHSQTLGTVTSSVQAPQSTPRRVLPTFEGLCTVYAFIIRTFFVFVAKDTNFSK